MEEESHIAPENKPPENNSFISRGCCCVPKMYDSNQGTYDSRCAKLDSYNWLNDIEISPVQSTFDCVEVRFKNSRKDFFRINTDYDIGEGDIVAVEATPGHDIGIVTLSGESCRLQMKKKNVDPASENMKRVYRKARANDIEKWIASVEKEDNTMYGSRGAAGNLGLEMKISDVEYQGDGTKAIFYYTADERVDFRKLIRDLADMFRVRIEMKQIGVRQEASRLGGIGSCGRELCCSTWLTKFRSVTTNAARVQQLALNPQKLAGQCGKLKCCINYEYDTYVDASRNLPDTGRVLRTKKGNGICRKSDAFKNILWYSYEDSESTLIAIDTNDVRKIMRMNDKNEKPEKLEDFAKKQEMMSDYQNPMDHFDPNLFTDK